MKEIQRTSVTDAVVDSIREMIESGQWAVGEKLPPEAVLCEELKVSRTCVREAVRTLRALRYVELRPGKGAFVEDFRKKQAEEMWRGTNDVKLYDLVEVRGALESLAVGLAVERASEAQITELSKIHSSFVEANAGHDMARLMMLDELFHMKITSYTENPLLVKINGKLLDSFRVYWGEFFTDTVVYGDVVTFHGRILESFKQHDAERAVLEMQRHLEWHLSGRLQ